MRIRDKKIKRASVTIADRTKKRFKSKGITVYGMSDSELVKHLEGINRKFFEGAADLPDPSALTLPAGS